MHANAGAEPRIRADKPALAANAPIATDLAFDLKFFIATLAFEIHGLSDHFQFLACSVARVI